MNNTFSLETDASDIGIGGCLRQNNQPVAYISRSLNTAEKNYSITEKEMLAAIWCMEKLEYYLVGKQFELISDHKAIEEVKIKLDFGSARIKRWFERIERFQFIPIYKTGENMVVADALSRSGVMDDPAENKDYERVLAIHKKYNHKCDIHDIVRNEGIQITEAKVKELIRTCLECQKRNCGSYQTCNYVSVESPGQLVAADILDPGNGKLIILLIDYFSRKLFGKVINNKSAEEVLNFLKQVYEHFKYKKLQTDNGKEFTNKKIKKWCDDNQIIQKLSIPYIHKSNGRIERVNRTIRSALNKTPGRLDSKLKKIIIAYNESRHRGIGMKPNEAIKEENHEKVKSYAEEYKKEFEKNKMKRESLSEGDKVILKNEIRKTKNDYLYDDIGEIIENIYGDVYLIKLKNGEEKKRHISQLKIFRERKLRSCRPEN